MLLREENIFPHFQPILCADACAVSGYEVLGRYRDENGNVESLGKFFHDPSVPADISLHVDRVIRKKAMERYAEEGCNKDIYLNMRLDWLAHKESKYEIYTLRWAHEYGIAPEHLIIEITEEEFNASEDYIKVLSLFTEAGCRIALDDYGKSASNIDRLACLSPAVIKLDMEFIQKSPESFHHRAYIHSLTSFAEHVGIEVLCEGIETQAQLDVCMETGGRYFQGFLFAYPQPIVCDAVVDGNVFMHSSDKLISSLHNRVTQANALRHTMDINVQRFVAEHVFVMGKMDIDLYLLDLMRTLPAHVMRVFLCDRRGTQLSGNIERRAGDFSVTAFRGANWLWRGFFQEAMNMFEASRQSGVTGAYRDMTSKERIFTYFCALSSDLFLFADVRRVPLSVSSLAVAAEASE
ncbi:MAG: EAL domain-containing protein [Desulfovibrio sp.]|jgi:EAL domain-containing protein (putative c-di-GMP-specific phosphodiesterase class I)|nr:EAL domain-containing protein [Desulfovibrio sp.]